ncbi:MAG TPA: hypothetical protein ENH28_04665 [Euryarchaeota archaeon]|nr:hypothetical protein [Euryarchaeota archaeon]
MGKAHEIKVSVNVIPGKVSINYDKYIEMNVEVLNIGSKTVTANIDAGNTAGLIIIKPERATVTLKPQESRILGFKAKLEEDALPGNYIVDIIGKTDDGDTVVAKANLRVTE